MTEVGIGKSVPQAVTDDPRGIPPAEGSNGTKEAGALGTDSATTFANGCHVCELAVDPETDRIAIENYVAKTHI